MEFEDIKRFIKLMEGTDITELFFEKDGSKIRLKRGIVHFPHETHPPGVPPSQPAEERYSFDGEDSRTITVTSPIVGTFYRSPSPDSEPFIEVGDYVKKGQVLCIVEAMKLMNEVECETDGTVIKVLLENGQAVEYGEPLFLLEPDTVAR